MTSNSNIICSGACMSSGHCITSGICMLSGGTCYATSIPPVCNGALVSGGVCSAGVPTDSAGVVYANNAIYNIERLRSIIPGYNPSNTGIAAYGFTAADLGYSWIPAVYHVSRGIVTRISDGGVTVGPVNAVCKEGYNVGAEDYYIVSWYEPAEALAGV